jgi:rod shape-determining protein MreC
MASENKSKLFTKNKNLHHLLVPFLFILTFLLVLFNKTDYFLVSKMKSASIDIFTPISIAITYPVNITTKTLNYVSDLRFVKLENNKLKEEVLRLKKWQTLALINIRENNAYKKLLNSTSNHLNIIKTTAVISQSPKIYSKTITVNAGLNHQIKNNYVAINERGLVGKAIVVSKNNSKILLINDQNSSIPVTNIDNDFYAIINGSTDGKYLISSFIKDRKRPTVGEILITSGNANFYPRDILVGKIISVSNEKIIALPFVDFENIEFVQIIKNN